MYFCMRVKANQLSVYVQLLSASKLQRTLNWTWESDMLMPPKQTLWTHQNLNIQFFMHEGESLSEECVRSISRCIKITHNCKVGHGNLTCKCTLTKVYKLTNSPKHKCSIYSVCVWLWGSALHLSNQWIKSQTTAKSDLVIWHVNAP